MDRAGYLGVRVPGKDEQETVTDLEEIDEDDIDREPCWVRRDRCRVELDNAHCNMSDQEQRKANLHTDGGFDDGCTYEHGGNVDRERQGCQHLKSATVSEAGGIREQTDRTRARNSCTSISAGSEAMRSVDDITAL